MDTIRKILIELKVRIDDTRLELALKDKSYAWVAQSRDYRPTTEVFEAGVKIGMLKGKMEKFYQVKYLSTRFFFLGEKEDFRKVAQQIMDEATIEEVHES